MDYLDQVKNELLKEISDLQKALSNAKKIRDDAPNATQSWSDTTRNESEKLVKALNTKIQNINNLVDQIPKKIEDKSPLWKVYTEQLGESVISILLVPEGFGGRQINDIKLVSTESELGKKITSRSR